VGSFLVKFFGPHLKNGGVKTRGTRGPYDKVHLKYLYETFCPDKTGERGMEKNKKKKKKGMKKHPERATHLNKYRRGLAGEVRQNRERR